MNRAGIEAVQLDGIKRLLSEIAGKNPFYSAKLNDTADASTLDNFIERVPFTYKRELAEDQRDHPPYGSNLTYPLERYTRFHQTSGTTAAPLRWLDTPESWNWMVGCWVRVYESAQAGPQDRVFFPFSFGPFLGFWVAFDAAARVGAIAISGGGMRSASRLQMMLDNGITILCSTPSYAVRLAEIAAEENIDLSKSKVRAILVAGEPGGSIPATRALIERVWHGARVVDHHGMTEIGPVSYECPERRGVLHIIETAFFPEVIDPGTHAPIGPGATGELVLTNLGRLGSPLLRYRTGDIVRRAEEAVCRCGSSEMALEGGILARTDDMVIIRGVNLFPSAVEEILRSCGVVEFRAETWTERALEELRIEIEPPDSHVQPEHLTDRVAGALRTGLGFRVLVSCVPCGSLPRFEGKAKRWFRR